MTPDDQYANTMVVLKTQDADVLLYAMIQAQKHHIETLKPHYDGIIKDRIVNAETVAIVSHYEAATLAVLQMEGLQTTRAIANAPSPYGEHKKDLN